MPDQQVTITGALGRDPELRYTAGGRPLCNFSVAVSNRWQNRQTKEWEEETTWFNVVAWGQLGENVAASLTKGSRVVVTGTIKTRTWERDDGSKGYAWDLNAQEVGPSLKWATAEVERIERENLNRDDTDYGGEEPF